MWELRFHLLEDKALGGCLFWFNPWRDIIVGDKFVLVRLENREDLVWVGRGFKIVEHEPIVIQVTWPIQSAVAEIMCNKKGF